jgi:hypothetical protein
MNIECEMRNAEEPISRLLRVSAFGIGHSALTGGFFIIRYM